MQKLISIFILCMVMVGAGAALGAYIWRPGAIERDELQRHAEQLERNFADSKERARAAADRARELELALTDSARELIRVTAQNRDAERRIADIVRSLERGSGELNRAIRRGESIADLLERAIRIVTELQERSRIDDPGTEQ